MKRSDFSYDLPQELIAQTPAEPRDAARMLVLGRQSGEYEDRIFRELDEYLNPGDLLILNDTKVLPARIYGVKEGTGAHVEFLLLTPKGNDVWEVLAGPGKRAKPGSRFIFGNGLMRAEILEVIEGGNRLAQLSYDGNFYNVLEKIGEMPLPPYITQKLEDQSQYQTIYARENGSAAAPTAGLHFTDELFERLEKKGIQKAFVTLHVGLGTFRPVKEENIEDHLMHSEHYYMPANTARMINETKKNGGRVIAVGTTSCRTLESVATFNGKIGEAEGWTDIFIYPGYEFKCMDGLITNFHLPESTLIMLVSAFCGYENTMNAYRHAVAEKYRFFSFGDAMLIL
ncbi:MAG TPA: tRNA preQ1(34) S-adenosylmethionine ribosyltransferase-isomerase QueA [Candidatus Onthovicinus excrementipullorum]|nr:tRNA preQ1(34) S-adenosylmethionine ribosyltransferase-isomerase QueA [Candidatus Onthovicinus excrementipullorum]